MVLADEWHEDTEKSTSGGNITRVQSNHHPHHSTTSANNNRVPWLGKGAPGRSQWGIYTPTANPWKSIFIDLWTPWKLFAFPIVEFASFVVSWSCSSFLTVNLTQSQAFAAPPYNFSSQTIGFFNFAILGGAMLGLFTAGPLSDWVSARATKKNRGIREPEMRLPAMSMSSYFLPFQSFLPSFLPSFPPSFLPSFLRSFLPSFRPSFQPILTPYVSPPRSHRTSNRPNHIRLPVAHIEAEHCNGLHQGWSTQSGNRSSGQSARQSEESGRVQNALFTGKVCEGGFVSCLR